MSFASSTGWADGVRRFASGTPAVLPSLFSRPGLAIIREIGIEEIRRRSLALTDHIIARADEAGLTRPCCAPIRGSPKTSMQAITAVMRKLLHSLHAMLRHRTAFQGEKFRALEAN